MRNIKIKIVLWLFLMLLLAITSFAQKATYNDVEAKKSVTVKGYRITGISNDTLLADQAADKIPTQYAVYRYVQNALAGISAGGPGLWETNGLGYVVPLGNKEVSIQSTLHASTADIFSTYTNQLNLIDITENNSLPAYGFLRVAGTGNDRVSWASKAQVVADLAGTGAGTLAAGNDSRILNGATAYGWGNHASAGYLKNITGLITFTGSATVSGNGTAASPYNVNVVGGGGADGNNFPVDVSAVNGVITINRSGLTAITATASGNWNINAATVTNGIYSNVNYIDPAWISSLAWSKITGAPAFITGNQSITLTPSGSGDVTGTATGATSLTPTLTIGNKKVTLAKMADMATASVFYRKTAGTGAPEVQTLATLRTDLNIPAAQVAADWNQTNAGAADYIKNKPAIPPAQVAADWNQTNPAALDFIKNKPVIPEECALLFENMQGDPMNNIALANLFNAKQNKLIAPNGRQYIGDGLAVRDLGPDIYPLFQPQYPVAIDTVTGAITHIAANINNLDTTGIFGGTYFVNASTRGTKPTGSKGGIVILMISSVNNYMTGSDKAVMTYYDYSSKITFTRYFDVVWSEWSTPYLNVQTGGTMTSNKAFIGFPDFAGSFPQPPALGGFIFGSNGGMPTFSTYTGKTMFDLSQVTSTKTFAWPNSPGEVTVAGNVFNTASNLVKLNASTQFPAIDAGLLFGYKANKLATDGGTAGQMLVVDPADQTKTKWVNPPTGGGSGDYVDIPETALDLSGATQAATTNATGLTGTFEGYRIGGKWVQIDILITASNPGVGVTNLTFPFPTALPTPRVVAALFGKNNIIKAAEVGAACVNVKADPLQSSRAYLLTNANNDGFVVSITSNAGAAAVWRVSLKYKLQDGL